MNIRKLEGIDEFELPTEDLLNYLSQILLTVVDEEIKKVSDDNNIILKNIQDEKDIILEKKNELNELTLEYSRKKQINEVLNLINALNREGALMGQNKIKVKKLLDEIDEKDYHSLRRLEQKLGLLRQNF